MIYFLDNSLQLQKIVTSKNVISAIHEHELNGLIRADVELDLSYANKFLILGIDHVGYYYKAEFYLHKIQRVEYDHVNETATVVLRHIFFEDMIFGKLIRDVRPQNQDALTVSRQTIDDNTRWQTIMTDVTGRLSTNFYWQVPYEVIEFMTENYRIEYLPKILFDGKKINGFQLHLANKIGEDKNIRIPYGSRVLDLKYEEDYSEIITKLVVHGKGEEVGDGYGRRINISDVNFSRNGVKSPVGSLYLEDESITNTYGNDGQTPREGREVFEDIEDANELAEAGYQHYLQVSRPQMLFTADVADIGDIGIGDSVMIIRREYDVYFNARIHKLSVDLLYPEDAQVELGDYKHFKESKIARKSREKNNRVQGQLSDRITRLKQEADERFDNEVGQWKSEYEQALIDVHAEIEADRENMTNLINTKTEEFDASFAAGMAEAERKRQENYEAMSERVTTTVDTTRTELENAISTEVTQAKDYAEQQAQEKANSVQSNLDSFKNSHQQLYDEVTGNLSQTRTDLLERINNIDTQSFNLIRGSRFDELDRYATSVGTVHDDEDMPYFRYGISSGNIQYIATADDIQFEVDKTYTLSLDYRTSSNVVIDYLRIIATDGSANVNIRNNITESDMAGIIPDGEWHRTFLTFTVPRNLTGTLRLGSDFSTSVKGQTDIRLPYLTTSGNTQWVFHPSDSYESIISVMSRIDEFEQSVWAELEGVYGNLSSTRTELQKQLDDARAELDGLEVGGRNLLLDQKRTSFPTTYEASIASKEIIEDNNLPSGWYLRFNNWTPSGSYSSFYFSVAGSYFTEPLTGKNITISMLVRSDVPFTLYGTEVTNEWKKVIRTIDNVSSSNIHWYINRNATIDISSIKVEKGNIATDWTPAPEDTDQKITTLNQQIEFIDGQLSAKLEQTDIDPINNKITEYGNSLTANAQSIETLISKSELHDGDITKWSNLTTETAEGLEQTISRVSSTEGKLSNAELAIEANADGLALRATKTEVEQAIDNIEVGGRNLLLDQKRTSFPTTYEASIASKEIIEDNNLPSGWYLRFNNWIPSGSSSSFYFSAESSYFTEPLTGKNITISMLVRSDVPFTLYGTEVTNEWKKVIRTIDNVSSSNIHWYINRNATIDISSIKVEKGNKATDWTPAPEDVDAKISKVSSDLEIEAGRIVGLVTDISKDYVKQSSVKVTSDRVTIGSTVVNGSTIGSVLSVSPTGIDAVADAMRLSGDLFVAGDITALAVQAIEGNFSRLFANQVEANTISVDYIQGRTAWFESQYTRNANIEKLVSQFVFTDAINAKVGNFIDLNAGNIVTAGLSANVIKSNHIEASTSLIRKLFVNSARIDELITQTHFVNEMHALTLNVVDLNASQIRARLLTANTIEAEWIKSGTALLDRVFSSTAMFERMMAKSGFITSLNTVTIDTDQITIRRPDGGMLISQGMQRFGSPIITKPFPAADVTFDGTNYVTSARATQRFERAYGEHSGRWMNIGFALSLRWDSVNASSFVLVTVRPQNLPAGVSFPEQSEQFIAYRDSGSRSYAMRIPLPVPTFAAMSYTLEFSRVGDNVSDFVQIRTERCWVSS